VGALTIVAAVMLLGGLFRTFRCGKNPENQGSRLHLWDTETMVRTTLQQSTGVKSVETNPISEVTLLFSTIRKPIMTNLKERFSKQGSAGGQTGVCELR